MDSAPNWKTDVGITESAIVSTKGNTLFKICGVHHRQQQTLEEQNT